MVYEHRVLRFYEGEGPPGERADALDELAEEGYEVVAAYPLALVPRSLVEVILRRPRRTPEP